MKRVIKFRGLRTDGKWWVYGVPFYISGERKCFIIDNCQSGNLTQEDSIFDGKEVEYHSVGQFTGLKDNNGVEIYEGDVVLLKADSESVELGRACGSWETRCIFDKNKCKFLLRCTHKPNLFWGFNDLDFNGMPFIKEVIYNIHES